MSVVTKITLDCPYCNEAIYESLTWFKKSYFTCPACDKGLSAGQFATIISNLERSVEANIEEMINGAQHSSCCGNKSSCCSGSDD